MTKANGEKFNSRTGKSFWEKKKRIWLVEVAGAKKRFASSLKPFAFYR